MVKVCAQGEMVAECTAPSGITYKRNKKTGLFDMREDDARVMAKGGGFYPSLAGVPSRDVGFRCTECGHGSYFTKCGKCGASCVKEE